MRKLKVYIAMSLDGFIAREDDDISWLHAVDRPGEDYGYASFTSQIDTYIVGRKTYDVVVKMTGGQFPPAQQFETYVITSQDLPDQNGVKFYKGHPAGLAAELLSKEGKDIYCDGGGHVIQQLLQNNLVDELTISVIPVLLGRGKRLFLGDTPEISLENISAKRYDSGLVQIKYIKKI